MELFWLFSPLEIDRRIIPERSTRTQPNIFWKLLPLAKVVKLLIDLSWTKLTRNSKTSIFWGADLTKHGNLYVGSKDVLKYRDARWPSGTFCITFHNVSLYCQMPIHHGSGRQLKARSSRLWPFGNPAAQVSRFFPASSSSLTWSLPRRTGSVLPALCFAAFQNCFCAA